MKTATRLTLICSLATAGVALAQVPAATAPQPAKDQVAHVQFSTIDSNKDGRVSQAEAQSHRELNTAFVALDANSDTYLSEGEFAKWGSMNKDKTP